MSGEECRATWAAAGDHAKAAALDAQFPNCFCESWSLVSADDAEVGDEEIVVRVLTTPGMYNAGEILTQKLTGTYAGGVSVIRSGASDAEILGTITNLIENAAEAQTLLGAAVFTAASLRRLGDPEKWFGVYHTPDGGKAHHADVLGTMPQGSGNQQKRAKTERRAELKELLTPAIIFSDQPAALLQELRSRGV